MRKIINQKAFLKLVKEEKKARNEGKYLHELNAEKAKQLYQYYELISDEVFWRHRTDYLSILTDFVDFKITIFELYQKFGNLCFKSRHMSKNIESNFEIHKQSVKFAKIITRIEELVDRVDPELKESNDFEITEADFRSSIKYLILDWLREYCDKPTNESEPIIFKSETFFDEGLYDIEKSFIILKVCLVLVGLLISSIIHI